MEVQKEAQRIMTMSVWKMYHSRLQRGGLRLHRSLQLSLVMRHARDLYLSARLEEEEDAATARPQPPLEEATPPPLQEPPAPEERLAPAPAPEERLAAVEPEPMETQEAAAGAEAPRTKWPPARASRKRRRSSLGKLGAAEAGLVPRKKARLAGHDGEEEAAEEERQPQRQEGPFPGLARVLQDRFAGLVEEPPPPPKGACRRGDGVLSIVVRAVVAF